MAEKKTEKERSVEDRLKALYQLQTLLSEIDRIKILRGELPNEVKDREDEIVRYQTRIRKFEDEIAGLRELIEAKKNDIEVRRQKIARYDEQINNVRNNREFAFLELLEERAIDVFGRVKNNGKTVSSNVDFYSGFVYEMIGLPQEIFTPLFAMARIVGWCAHRNEELNFEGKRIIRPAYKNVLDEVAYVPIKKR